MFKTINLSSIHYLAGVPYIYRFNKMQNVATLKRFFLIESFTFPRSSFTLTIHLFKRECFNYSFSFYGNANFLKLFISLVFDKIEILNLTVVCCER